MQLNLFKAIKSTHRNAISRVLHLIGLSLYAIGFTLLAGYYLGSLDILSPIIGIILFPIAIGLFLTGHKIEGNLRAMTLIILLKYLKSKLRFWSKSFHHLLSTLLCFLLLLIPRTDNNIPIIFILYEDSFHSYARAHTK